MSNRLDAILSRVEGNCLADIGCDHGKIAVYALKSGLVSAAIATDISAMSLEKAKVLASLEGVKNIAFRVGDGMSVLADGEADIAVIAGMGGKEIISIMQGRRAGIKKYILSPNRNAEQLREYLVRTGLKIMRDKIVRDSRHFYSIIECIEGAQAPLNKRNLYLGDNDIEDKDYIDYLIFEKNKYNSAVSQAGEKVCADTLEKLRVIEEELAKIC